MLAISSGGGEKTGSFGSSLTQAVRSAWWPPGRPKLQPQQALHWSRRRRRRQARMLCFPMLLPLPSCRHLVGPAGERGGTKKTKSSCKALEVPSPHPGSRYFIPKSPPQPHWQPPPGCPNSKCFLYNWSKHRVSIVRLLIFYYFVGMWEWIFTKPALLSGFIQTKTVMI